MKNGLKMIAFLVAFAILVQPVAVFAEIEQTAPASYVSTENMEVIETLLGRLGIVTDTGDAADEVTKGMYIKYMLNMLQIPLSPATEQLFFDVPLTSSYADVVHTAYISGLIMGGTDGNAGIENPVTLNDAIIISIRALNATGMMKQGDQSVLGYMQIAAQLGLYDGLSSAANAELNREDALRLLYNTVNSEYMTTVNGVDYSPIERTLLEAYYGIYRTHGIVESCHYGDIYGGNPEHSGYVTIDGIRYRYDDVSSKEMLGQKVIVYYSDRADDGIREILYMYSKGNGILTVELENVLLHRQGVLSYSDDDGSAVKAKLSDTALTLLNGERISVSSLGMDIPAHGTVTLLDHDTDGTYDVVLYKEYVISIVTSVNVNDEKIYSQKGEFSILDLSAYDEYYIYDQAGDAVGLSSIAKDAVLNISAKEDQSLVEITVCTDVAEFSIASIWKEEYLEHTYYYVEDEEGNEYRTVSDFADLSDDNGIIVNLAASLGKTYRFALNTDGRLAAVLDWADTSDYIYGYVIASQASWGLEDSCVRILTEKSEVHIYPVASKVRVTKGTATTTVSGKDFASACANGVLRFRTDADGKLCAAELPQEEGAESGLRYDCVIPSGNSVSSRFYASYNMLGGQVLINESTRVFFLPDSAHGEDAQWYSASMGTALVNESYYPSAVCYKYDDDIYADVLVIIPDQSTLKSSLVMFVEELSKVYDETTNGEYDAVTGYVNGNQMTYCFENDGINPSKRVPAYTVGQGDVIRFTINPRGNIAVLDPVFDYSEKKVYNFQNSSTKHYAFNNGVCQVYGQMNDIYDGVFMNVVHSSDEEQKKYYYPITSTTRFYEYDETARKETIKTITANDVPTLRADPTTTAYVLIVTMDTTVPLVIVYK